MPNNIEEDIKIVEELLKDFNCKETDYTMLFKEKAKSIENILNAYIHEKVAKEEVEELLENSISKDKVKEYLEIEKERFKVYKKASEENENLKGQMWHHMGAKNMCERLLGIEKTVTLD